MKSQPENIYSAILTTHQELEEAPQLSSADGKTEETFGSIFFFGVEAGVGSIFGHFKIYGINLIVFV